MRERPEAGDPEESMLDRAWDALEAGDAQLALELARKAPIDVGGDVGGDGDEQASRASSRWILEASAQLELDDLPAARAALLQASGRRAVEEDADLCWTAAEIALREWKLEEALRLFELTAKLERTTPALGRLALCADALGDFDATDRYLREAERLDPEGWAFPPRLSEDELQEVLDEAIGRLDEDFQEALEETPILIEPMPRRELLESSELAQTPPDMLGLFVGASRLERSGEDGGMPASIHLFQRNLERACADREDLVQELRVTLYHEIGHMLGFDEDGVDRMGLA